MKKLEKLGLLLTSAVFMSALAVSMALPNQNVVETNAADRGTSQTLRVWIDRQGHWENGVYGIHYWGEGIDSYAYASKYTNFATGDGSEYLAAIDVPTEIIGCNYQFVVKENAEATTPVVWARDVDEPFADGTNNQIWYVWYEGEQMTGSWGTRDTDGTYRRTKAAALHNVFEAYYTCDPSASYGYNAIPQLINTWIRSGVPGDETDAIWYIEGMMSDNPFTDYASGDTAYEGEKDTTYTIQDKYEAMTEQYLLHQEAGAKLSAFGDDFISSPSFIVIIVASVVTVASVTALVYFGKRQKKVNN